MDPGEALIMISTFDRILTGVFSAIKAIKTDDPEVQAKKDALIAKMKTLEDFEAPV